MLAASLLELSGRSKAKAHTDAGNAIGMSGHNILPTVAYKSHGSLFLRRIQAPFAQGLGHYQRLVIRVTI